MRRAGLLSASMPLTILLVGLLPADARQLVKVEAEQATVGAWGAAVNDGGLGGNDTIEGRAGDDVLLGGVAGKVTGNGGADALYGQNGDDTLDFPRWAKRQRLSRRGAGTDKRTTDPTERSIVGFP